MSTPTVEYMLERRRLLDQAIERQILQEERFGINEDYEQGVVLIIRYSFDGSQVYTYTAAKFGVSWYTSSRYDNATWRKVMSWTQLLNVLMDAESVEIVTETEDI